MSTYYRPSKPTALDDMCKECLGTGKRKITFEDCFGNPMPEKTVYLKCNCKEVV